MLYYVNESKHNPYGGKTPMQHTLGVIGCGNMAKAILRGIRNVGEANLSISRIAMYDIFPEQYSDLSDDVRYPADSIPAVAKDADIVLLSVKPQNYPDVLATLKSVPNYSQKLYISIGAGISSQSVSDALDGALVVRVLPNVPMLIGMGVSIICRNDKIDANAFSFIQNLFASSGSVLLIDEKDMNPMIGVTSSSPAYVFRFIDAIYEGALAQGLPADGLLEAICDVVIGSATMLRNGTDTPSELISKVASKGGTTEQALLALDRADFKRALADAMLACTARADELGAKKS